MGISYFLNDCFVGKRFSTLSRLLFINNNLEH